ncbi:uncharacterized protein [Panulirus ornatus]|uniref:uncharacterized protein isoform X6 n=1 Tax=Panulirus ornatus TaxID=150431 RepID=UPI003A891018
MTSRLLRGWYTDNQRLLGVSWKILCFRMVIKCLEVIKCDLSVTKGLTVRNLKINSTLSGRGSKRVLVNGVDASEIRNQAVLTSGGSSVIRGRKTFVNAFTANHLNAVSVGGVTVCDLVVVTRDDIIADNLVYTAPISIFGDVLVSGLVDGQDVDHLFSTRLTLDGIQTLSASYIFEAIRVEDRGTASEGCPSYSVVPLRSASYHWIYKCCIPHC